MGVTLDEVRTLDRKDPLARYKSQFNLPEGVLYLDGNSLGAQPKATPGAMTAVLDQWRDELIKSWNQGWFDAPERLGDKLAPIVGARKGEALVTDATSINLFKLLGYVAGQTGADRKIILSEEGNFPTDSYVAQGFCRFGHYEHRLLPENADVVDYLDGVSVVVLSHVRYRTGELRDMASTTKLIHEHGAEVIWDLCHSAGAVPVDLNGSGVHYAVGCTYKYLNGGPGAPAFVYVHKDYQQKGWQPLSGWHGHTQPFAFVEDYAPASNISHFRAGTHHILSYTALEASLNMWSDVDMQDVRDKSLRLNDLFRESLSDLFEEFNIRDTTPEADKRGSQASLTIKENGYAIVQALIARGVIGDYREPGLMRFGFTPLYLSYEDVWQAANHMREVLTSGEYKNPQFNVRSAVT